MAQILNFANDVVVELQPLKALQARQVVDLDDVLVRKRKVL